MASDWSAVDEQKLLFESADVCGAGTRDKPLRTSVWEATLLTLTVNKLMESMLKRMRMVIEKRGEHAYIHILYLSSNLQSSFESSQLLTVLHT